MNNNVAFERAGDIYELLIAHSDAPSDILLLLGLVTLMCGKMIDLDWSKLKNQPTINNVEKPIEKALTEAISNFIFCSKLLEAQITLPSSSDTNAPSPAK